MGEGETAVVFGEVEFAVDGVDELGGGLVELGGWVRRGGDTNLGCLAPGCETGIHGDHLGEELHVLVAEADGIVPAWGVEGDGVGFLGGKGVAQLGGDGCDGHCEKSLSEGD